MANKVYFRSSRWEVDYGHYEHLTVDIFEDLNHRHDQMIRLTWQTDEKCDYWYGGKVEIKASNYESLQQLYKLAARIISSLKGYEIQIEDIQTKLKRLKAIEVVYDGRLMDYVEINQVSSPDKRRWMDNHRTMDNHSIHYAVMAKDEAEAKSLILAKAAEKGDFNFISQFAECGYPVWNTGNDSVPDSRPLVEKARLSVKSGK